MFKNLSPEVLGISGRDREVIELALSHGFKGLDLDVVDFAEQVKAEGFARASRSIVSARLKIGSFALPVRWQHDGPEYEQDLAALPALAETAAQMNCTRATTTVEPSSDKRRYHENFEFHRARLGEIAGVLAAQKIRLGIGFLAPAACRGDGAFQFMQTFDEVVLLLRSISAPNAGLALDSWHWHLGGGKLEALRAVPGEKIVTVALADAAPDATAANAEVESRRLPGEGAAVDNAGLLSALAEVRFDGPVTPAPDKSQLPSLGRDKMVKHVGAALDAVWKAAGLSSPLAAARGR